MISPSLATTDTITSRLLGSIEGLNPSVLGQIYDQVEDQPKVSLQQQLIHSGLVGHRQLAEVYANHYLLPLFDPPADAPLPVDPEVAQLLPSQFCCEQQIAPLNDDGKTLELAIFAPDSLVLADAIRSRTGRQMRPMFATQEVIARVLQQLYGVSPVAAPSKDQSPSAHALIRSALRCKASEILVEPVAGQYRVRMRIETALRETEFLTGADGKTVVDELFALAKITPNAEVPSQGLVRVRDGKRRVAVRLTVLPTLAGNRLTLSIIDHSQTGLKLDRLGFDDQQLANLHHALSRPAGITLVAGRACSGKRTTLYSCLNHLRDPGRVLASVEDRVDHRFEGVHQTQIDAIDAKRFHANLQRLCDSHADVVLIDQLRDLQSTNIAFQIAMQGKRVLASIAAPHLPGMIHSLADLGLTDNQIANSVNALVWQDLQSTETGLSFAGEVTLVDDSNREAIRAGEFAGL